MYLVYTYVKLYIMVTEFKVCMFTIIVQSVLNVIVLTFLFYGIKKTPNEKKKTRIFIFSDYLHQFNQN